MAYVSLLNFAGRVREDQFRQVQLSFSDRSKRELELADDSLLNEYPLQQPITTSWVRITVLSCWNTRGILFILKAEARRLSSCGAT